MSELCPDCGRPFATDYESWTSCAPMRQVNVTCGTRLDDDFWGDETIPDCKAATILRLRSLLEAYRSLAKAADAMCAEYRDCAWSTDTQSAYDTARATVANLDRCTPATTEQKAAAGKGGAV